MSHILYSPETKVPEALQAAGAIPGVFNAHRTACVGCALARFCTLRDVASAYGLALEPFIEELQQAAHANSLHRGGTPREKTN